MRTALALIATAVAMSAQAESGVERWSATSTTAMAITGDITLSPRRLTAAGKTLPLSVSADIQDFGTPTGPKRARVLKVTVPADPTLLHGNRLCGGSPVRWLAVYRSEGGRALNLAVFSGETPPAREAGPDLCGTYLYAR